MHERLDETLVELAPDNLQEIKSASSKITVQGARMPKSVLKNDWSLSRKNVQYGRTQKNNHIK